MESDFAPSMINKLLKNMSFSLASKAWRIILPIFVTPFIVKKLGIDAYGVMSLLTVFAGYFALSDLGLTATIEKYIAEYKAKGLVSRIKDTTQVGIVLYSFLSIMGAVMLFIGFYVFLNRFIDIPSELIYQTKISYLIVTVTFSISIYVAFFSSILKG